MFAIVATGELDGDLSMQAFSKFKVHNTVTDNTAVFAITVNRASLTTVHGASACTYALPSSPVNE